MIRPLALTVFTLALATTALAQSPDEVTARYHELAEAGDEAGLAQLWTSAPGLVLVTIDADLEGSLAAWEESPESPDDAAIAALHARARLGARVASEATGRAIFDDYANAFVGWDDDDKRAFREGQAAFGEAMGALRAGDARAALSAARRCTELAQPLGDWWGTAMGLSAEGQALLALDRADEALVPSSRAVLLYDQLGLAGSEYGSLRALAAALVVTEHWSRAEATCTRALALAEALGDEDGAAQLREQLTTVRASL